MVLEKSLSGFLLNGRNTENASARASGALRLFLRKPQVTGYMAEKTVSIVGSLLDIHKL